MPRSGGVRVVVFPHTCDTSTCLIASTPRASAIVLPGKRVTSFHLKQSSSQPPRPPQPAPLAAEPGETGSRLQSLTCRLWRLPHDLAKLHVSTSPVASM